MLWEYGLLLNWGEIVRVNVYCPICGRAGIKRKLLEVDKTIASASQSEAKGKIYPWCKAHKENVEVELPVDEQQRKNASR